MDTSRLLVGIICAGLLAGCADQSPEVDGQDLNVAVSPEEAPNLPLPPPDATCALIQRGTLGQVGDSDIGYGDGPDWNMGAYPFSWTGASPYDHWSAFQFDMSVVPANKVVVQATFSVYASWNMESSNVRAHRIKSAWSESTVTWNNFGGNAAWDSAVLGSFDPNGGGFRSVDVTALAQGWISGSVANDGLLLEEDPVELHNYFDSEVSTIARRPSLSVCWVDAPPPACQPVNGACSANADCCDGGTCNDGTCQFLICGSAGAWCDGNSGCCDGNVCNGRSEMCCPAPMCSQPGQACSAASPCCSGICSAGICPGGDGQCGAVGTTCSADANCCGGSCFDGMCVATNHCTQVDEADAYGNNLFCCDPSSPCCDGAHCVFGICWNDALCIAPGAACDDNNDMCCWDLGCINGSCQ